MNDFTKPGGDFPLCVAHPSLFTAWEIERYEHEVLANKKANEQTASSFFAKYPKFLYLGEGNEVRREVVIADPTGQKDFRADFFRRAFGRTSWDIIELKSPKDKFVTGLDTGHIRPSHKLTMAEHQALDYRKRIIENAGIRLGLLSKGINVCRPRLFVVVGRTPEELDVGQMEEIKARLQGGVEALTYDDILRFAKEHYAATKLIVLPVASFSALGAVFEFSVREELFRIKDPEVPVNLIDLGLVYDVECRPVIQGGFDVNIKMTTTCPGLEGCAYRSDNGEHSLITETHEKVQKLPSVHKVKVEHITDPPWNQNLITDEGKMKLGMI